MSLGNALLNAVSGLAVSSRGTELVADNLANAKTPGFARREMHVSSRGQSGGVKIDGIQRVVNTGLLAQQRRADAVRNDSGIRLKFFRDMENVIGLPGTAGGLSQTLNEFQVSLVNASRRPDSNLNLENVVQAARTLSDRLRNASKAVQTERMAADSAIEKSVKELNSHISQVAYLNRRISGLSAQGKNIVALADKRQEIIGKINVLVPVNEIPRGSEKVALFTAGGIALLDGTVPAEINFNPTEYFVPERTISEDTVGRLIVNGSELSEAQLKFFAGGAIHANFAVRDDLAPQVQQDLDSFAMMLHEIFSDTKTDSTLGDNSPGLFLDGENKAEIDNLTGLSSRLRLNQKIDPTAGGDLWRIRDGLNAEREGSAGNSELLVRLIKVIDASQSRLPGNEGKKNVSLIGRLAEIETRIASTRISFEKDHIIKNSAADALSLSVLEDGVNTDAEIQKLITLGQSYAANARVVQAVDEMLEQILRW